MADNFYSVVRCHYNGAACLDNSD